LQFDTIRHIFAVSPQILQLLKCNLQSTSVGWVRLQTSSHQLHEATAKIGTVVGQCEGDSFCFEGRVIIGVIILGFFERDEFKYDHCNSEKVRFVDIILDLFVHVFDLIELLGR